MDPNDRPSPMPRPPAPTPGGQPDKKGFRFSFWYFGLVLLALMLFNLYSRQPTSTIEYSEFRAKILSGEIKRVEMDEELYLGFPYTRAQMQKLIQERRAAARDSVKTYSAVPVTDPNFVRLLDSMRVEYYAKPVSGKTLGNVLFNWLLPFFLFMGLWTLLGRRLGNVGQGVLSFGKSRARVVAEGDTQVRFADVAGVEEAKEELQEVVDFLRDPSKYTAIGGRIPKGVLLVGPPGTGKTLLARAVAGEAKAPFFRMSGADFVEMFVGVGASRVRDLFRQAREKAPCIIFIDELDAIGKSRGGMLGGNDEREQTLNQLLVEMDGFDARTGVIILAATNRPEILDPALMRAGRFDRQILVDRPDLPGREAILRRHAQDVKMDPSADLALVARKTPGFVGADLANLINESALLAVRAGRQAVAQADLDEAIEKVMAGLKKRNRLINPKEREIVAYHETGHALMAHFTPGADRVEKISIIPRGLGALGFTMQLPTEDRYLVTRPELLGKIDVLLGGRASEEIIFGDVSTGAANDLTRATEIARNMIVEYGMSDKFRNVVFHPSRPLGATERPGELGLQREYAETTQQYIDEQIAAIVADRYRHALETLRSKLPYLHRIAKRILETETITDSEFRALLDGETDAKASVAA